MRSPLVLISTADETTETTLSRSAPACSATSITWEAISSVAEAIAAVIRRSGELFRLFHSAIIAAIAAATPATDTAACTCALLTRSRSFFADELLTSLFFLPVELYLRIPLSPGSIALAPLTASLLQPRIALEISVAEIDHDRDRNSMVSCGVCGVTGMVVKSVSTPSLPIFFLLRCFSMDGSIYIYIYI
ncbi:hypothetical protein ZOSMA_31G01340 [Zostera marina]|uniref:Uncharacterized protein n=1 Tax=Zostera marina TaxID=29655 RepID=A0A0K9PBH3_ZOSMR|nr:hypothetical protein ZOSMA_31G01340 [Zostera marina]